MSDFDYQLQCEDFYRDDDLNMPPVGTYAFTARMMADLTDYDDPDFWDRWKDEMKDRELMDD